MIIKNELLSVEYKINETSLRKYITLNPPQKHKIHNIDLTLYVAVTQFTYGKLRYCYVKS